MERTHRHYVGTRGEMALLFPTLQGCQNEPVFASLSALVYQHSMTPLALPCRLLLPEQDMTVGHQPLYSEDNLQRLMDQGAGTMSATLGSVGEQKGKVCFERLCSFVLPACNVFYLLSLDTESLTGPQAIRRKS